MDGKALSSHLAGQRYWDRLLIMRKHKLVRLPSITRILGSSIWGECNVPSTIKNQDLKDLKLLLISLKVYLIFGRAYS